MSKYTNLFDYFRECPQLRDLWSIAATEDRGVKVILPQGTSPAVQYQESTDALGGYECTIEPYPSVYEDYQINCYSWYDADDESEPQLNENVLSFEEVQKICDWVAEQDERRNFPDIGEKVVSIECYPFTPQIRYVNQAEQTVGYFITVRVRYVNRRKRKTVYYECSN